MSFNAILWIFTLNIIQLKTFNCDRDIHYKDMIFVVISQRDSFHVNRAVELESDLEKQTEGLSTIYMSHRDFEHIGDWTVLPLFEKLWNTHEAKFSWICFCTDSTKINVTNLMLSLWKHKSEGSFIGRAIKDIETTIIHHFATPGGLSYPIFDSGFCLSHELMERLMETVDENVFKKVDFSIDSSYELALFIKKHLNDIELVNSPDFCIHYSQECATYVRNKDLCDDAYDLNKIVFAVKTCKKFHKDRVPVVQKTWGKNCLKIQYFSDFEDKKIPTVKLNVKNTKSGHCGKTQAILQVLKKRFEEDESLRWMVLSDDDTLFSVPRLQSLISCYDTDEAYILGERYGFNVYSGKGYNYITGGGGAVLSRSAVLKLSKGNCICPSDSTPDDMFLLGVCLQRLNITLIHVPLFHQARPDDYNPEYLQIGKPISFHKHWMIDPLEVYEKWFMETDASQDDGNIHTEL